MRNIWILTKNYLYCMFGSLRRKGKRSKNASGVGLIILLLCGLAALITIQAVSYAMSIKEAGATNFTLLLYNGFMLGFFIVLFFAMQKITGGSRANDTDLLLSMPIPKTAIIIAKAISKYLFSLATAAIFMFPYIAVYLAFAGFSVTTFFASLIILLLVPLLAVGITYFLDFVTIILFKKSRAANILTSILSIIFIFAFLAVYIYAQTEINPALNPDGKMITFAPISWFLDFALDFNLISLLLILAITVLPFVLGVTLFATTFDKQNQISKRKTVNIETAVQPNRSISSIIFRKELKQYLNTPIFMINTLIGPILIFVVTGWLAIDNKAISSLITQLGMPASAAAFCVTIIFCFLTAMVFASCSAISLEGKNFWILKTMPIDTKLLLFGKTLLNILLVTPAIIICSIILLFVMHLTAFQFLIMLLLPILVNIIIAFGGLFINLLYPKFDWESEQTVIKQSISVLLTTLLGFAVGLLPVIAALIFGFNNLTAVYLISLAALAIIATAAIVLTMTKGKQIYEKL